MSIVATDLKELFTISIKARHDSYTDQYHRIFMVKILLACTVVMGLQWYTDNFNCIMPGNQASSDDFVKFVQTTCWIQGMYVYRQLSHTTGNIAYYGIPKDMDNNGLINGKTPCRVTDKFHKLTNAKCEEMTKTFYIQYQYMPFYVCALALFYYVPYMVHKTVNHDLINLREEIKKDEVDTDNIVKFYFKERKRRRGPTSLTVRQIINILVKVAYIVVNFVAFFGTDSLLGGEFVSYGGKWVDWSKNNNSIAFDYLGSRKFPKPGNALLPPFGYCELYSSSKDVKTSFGDKHKVICEISQHILYQYVFIILWFAMIFGMIFSFIGLIILLVNYIVGICGIRRLRSTDSSRKLFDSLTYREIEYLEFMRKKNIPVYGEVLDKLREKILGSPAESLGSTYDQGPPKYSTKR